MLSGVASTLLYLSLAMVGDSIVAQMPPQQPGMQITNLGVRGNTVAQIAARMASVPSGATHVLIEGGTNDLVGLGTDAGIIPGYTAILNRIPSTKKVIVAGVPQVDEAALEAAHPGWTAYLNNAKIAAMNTRLVTLCASYPNCMPATALMDLSMVGKTVDGIHPTEAGYVTIWQALSAYF